MQHNSVCKRKPRNMRLSWLSRCNFYSCLCHKLALWPWASHQISLTHMNSSEKGYCKALISADDYCTHKSSSSLSSLFSSLAISLSFQRWSRKLSGNTQNTVSEEKTGTTFSVPPGSGRQGCLLPGHCEYLTLHCNHQRWQDLNPLRAQLIALSTILGHTK